MNIPRLLGVLFEIKAQGTTVHLDVRRYPPPTGPLLDTKFHLSRRPRVIAERDDRRVARARRWQEGGGGELRGRRGGRVALVFRRRRVRRTHAFGTLSRASASVPFLGRADNVPRFSLIVDR